MSRGVRKTCHFSCREELRNPELLSALVSWRDYYTDIWWMVTITVILDAPYTLEQLHEVLRYPVFPLHLGHKNHPLALPLIPLLLGSHAAEVLCQAYRQHQAKFNLLRLSLR